MTGKKVGAARSNRTTPARASNYAAETSRTHSIARRSRRAKYQRRRIALLLVLAALVAGITYLAISRQTEDQPAVDRPASTITATSEAAETPAETAEAQPEATPRYALSDYERDVVERVVMAEAGGESYEGQMLVAQCILNAAEKTGTAPSEAVVTYQYTSARPDPTQSVRDAVAAVFDDGDTVTDEPVMYFYNPARVTSAWHESQIFVIEVGGHRFFAERSTIA
ncbi:MAG: cell wall hydrolase [Clostridiaceae bacterium]|nr:cell wall hydrolase [Clostridiaceae bacterium]